MFSILSKLIKAINSNNRNGEVAAAISMGFLLAFVPSDNIIWFLLFFIVLMLKIHIPTMLIFLGLFKLLTPFYDKYIDLLGIKIISIDFIQAKLIEFYNLPYMFFTNVNSALVVGGLVAGIVLWVPIWFLSVFIIKFYRLKILPMILKSKFYRFYKKLPLISKLTDKAVKGVNVFGGKS